MKEMKGILSCIVRRTAVSVAERRLALPSSRLGDRLAGVPRTRSLIDALRASGPHFIAEIKRRSPSAGEIAPDVDPVAIAAQYLEQGATAISVLTEPHFFGGSLESLRLIRRQFPDSRLLMKDFILEEYQLLEGRLAGADAALLIASLLDDAILSRLTVFARAIGLETLIEVHDEEEMLRASTLKAPLIGVNNRNLKTMEVSLNVSRALIAHAPPNSVLVAESGLRDGRDIRELHRLGYRGFLVGTALMGTPAPGQALAKLRKDTLCA